MQTAYQVLSAIVIVAIPIAMITGIMVEYLRESKKPGTEEYKKLLRLRNLEIYLLGICYPAKAIASYFTPAFQPIDILWGVLWLLLAVFVFKKYRFGHDAVK